MSDKKAPPPPAPAPQTTPVRQPVNNSERKSDVITFHTPPPAPPVPPKK